MIKIYINILKTQIQISEVK